MNSVVIWQLVIENGNSWVLFENGTVVIFLPEDAPRVQDLAAEAVERLKKLEIKNVAVAELVRQGGGWIVNCGDDFILSYLPHGDYASRYERIAAMIDVQRLDQAGLKIVHIEKKK